MRILANACAFASLAPPETMRNGRPLRHCDSNIVIATPCISQQFRSGLTPYVVEAMPLVRRDLYVLSTADTFRFVTRIEFGDCGLRTWGDYLSLWHTPDTITETLNKLDFVRDVTLPLELHDIYSGQRPKHIKKQLKRLATTLVALPQLTKLEAMPVMQCSESAAILMTHPNASVRVGIVAALAKRGDVDGMLNYILQRLGDRNLSVMELMPMLEALSDHTIDIASQCQIPFCEQSEEEERAAETLLSIMTKLSSLLGESDSVEVVRRILQFVAGVLRRSWHMRGVSGLSGRFFIDSGFVDTCVNVLKELAAIIDIRRVTARDAAVLGVAPVLDKFCSLCDVPCGFLKKLVQDGLVDTVVSLHRNQPLRAALQFAAGPNHSQATIFSFQLLQSLAASFAPERVVEIGIDQRAAAIAVHRYEHDRRSKLTRVMHHRETHRQQQQQQQQREEQSALSAASSDETVREDWADPQLLMNFLLAMSTLPLQAPSHEHTGFELTYEERNQLNEEQIEQREQEFAQQNSLRKNSLSFGRKCMTGVTSKCGESSAL